MAGSQTVVPLVKKGTKQIGAQRVEAVGVKKITVIKKADVDAIPKLIDVVPHPQYQYLKAISEVACMSGEKKLAQIAKESFQETSSLGFKISMAQRLLQLYDPYPRNAPFWERPDRITEWPTILRQNAEFVLNKVDLVCKVLTASARWKAVPPEAKQELKMGVDLPLPDYLWNRLKGLNLTLVRDLIATQPKVLRTSGIDPNDFQLLKEYLGKYGVEFQRPSLRQLSLEAIVDVTKIGEQKPLEQIAKERLLDIGELRFLLSIGMRLLQEYDPYPRDASLWPHDDTTQWTTILSQNTDLVLQKVDFVCKVLNASAQWEKSAKTSQLQLRMGEDLPLPDYLLDRLKAANLTAIRTLITTMPRILKDSGFDLEDVELLKCYLDRYGVVFQRSFRDGEIESWVSSVSELELTNKTKKCLQSLGIHMVDDLVRFSENDLLKAPTYLDKKTINEIKEVLAIRGLQLAKDWNKSWSDGEALRGLLKQSVSKLEFTDDETKDYLSTYGVYTLHDMVMPSEGDLKKHLTMGRRSIDKIKMHLVWRGLQLAKDWH